MLNFEYMLMLGFSGCVTALMAMFLIYRCQIHPAVKTISLAMLFASVFSVAVFLQQLYDSLAWKEFWTIVKFSVGSFTAFLWLIFALQYSNRAELLTRRFYLVMTSITGIFVLLIHSDPLHHLFFKESSVYYRDFLPVYHPEPGPLYWLFAAFVTAITFGGIGILIQRFRQSDNVDERRQLTLLIAASLSPWTLFFLTSLTVIPAQTDFCPFGYMLSGILCLWGMLRYQMFATVPLARDRIFENMHDGVLILDVSDRILDFNPAAQHIMPNLSKKDIGRPAKAALHSFPKLVSQLQSNTQGQIKFRANKGTDTFVYESTMSPLTGELGQAIGKIAVIANITEQAKVISKLRTLATIDGLTNVFNRRYFIERCEKEKEYAATRQIPAAFLLIDLDHFKLINDQYGHIAGDTVLKNAASICNNIIKNHGIFGRFGGEEFAALLPTISLEKAQQVAELLRQSVERAAITHSGQRITITASFGLAYTTNLDAIDINELMSRADKAMYAAKNNGRNKVKMYE